MLYYLDEFGCAKNQVDAELMLARLDASGWKRTENPSDAETIIVNSCGFVEDAKRESINAVLGWKNQFPEKRIILTGCLALRYGDELAEILPEADVIGKFSHGGTEDTEIKKGGRPLLGFPGQAFVKIAEGCNNRCSFCAIPLIRGGLVCREAADIVDECAALLSRGAKELCLIAQDSASFPRLAELAESILKLPGDYWLRLLYLHPDHFPFEIIEVMKNDARFLPYFDIPFQHGSPSILKMMNRKGDAEKYLKLIEKIRTVLPDAVIRSTFLVGFPGETEEDFAALLDFQAKAEFDWLGVFAYSREEDTPAYSFKNRVPKKIAAQRKKLIEEKQVAITEKRMERFVGRDAKVLIEEEIDDDEGGESLWLGRLWCQAPEVDGATVVSKNFSRRHQLLATEGTETIDKEFNERMQEGIKPGLLLPCRVVRRNGFDLEVEV